MSYKIVWLDDDDELEIKKDYSMPKNIIMSFTSRQKYERKYKMKRPIVKVLWDDCGSFWDGSNEDNTWLDLDTIIDCYKRADFIQESVGYLIYEDDESILLAQSIDSEEGMQDKFANILRIIRRNISEVQFVN